MAVDGHFFFEPLLYGVEIYFNEIWKGAGVKEDDAVRAFVVHGETAEVCVAVCAVYGVEF